MAANAVRAGDALHVAQHKIDEAFALAPHAIHDLAAVDADCATGVNAKIRRFPDGMGGIGSGNEELARHAAHARAGGAIIAAFDDCGAGSCGLGRAVRGKSGRAGADDGDVNLQGLHQAALRAPKYASRSSALPMSLPPMKICGQVPLPETARSVLDVTCLPRLISL